MRILKGWNTWELLWLLLFSAMAVGITIIGGDNLFDFSVFITGVLCVVLAAKGSIFNYVVGLYNTVAYAWVAYQNQLYGEMGLNLFFYLPTAILGFIMWRNYTENGTVRMRRLRWSQTGLLACGSVAAIFALGYCLSLIPGQNSPYIDATTNVLSVVATLLMMSRFREQWMSYIVLNVFTVFMWTLRTLNGSPEGPMMLVMWSAYLVNSIYGLYNWTKGAGKPQEVGE